jgi:hypothetical protein
MKEKIIVVLERFRDKDGLPTCATDFIKGEVCEFYRTSHLGTREECLFEPDTGVTLRRRDNDFGTLIPGKCCLLFKEDTKDGR